jgi:membrane protein DedA with SNARE-associated domain
MFALCEAERAGLASELSGVYVLLAQIQPLVAQHGYCVVFLTRYARERRGSAARRNRFGSRLRLRRATGQLSLSLVITCATAGAIIGDNIGFWISRTWGTKYLLRYGKLIHLPESRLKLGQYLFDKHGAKIVFFGRFVAFLRVFAALLAGVNKYHWPQFLFYNAAGGITWAAVFGIGAYRFGDFLHRISGPLGIIALAGIVVGIIAFTYIVRREEKKMEQRLSNFSSTDLKICRERDASL